MAIIEQYQPGKEFLLEEGCYLTELYNGTDDPDCSVARARLPAGCSTRLHSLENVIERYVIIEGKGEVRVGDVLAGVGPMDTVAIPAGQPQCIRNTGETDLVFLCICTPRFQPECYRDLED